RMVWHLWHCDHDFGTRVAQAAGIALSKAKDLPPLEGKPAPHARRAAETYTSGRAEQPTSEPGRT
ncbi:MAG TPA: catalase, partial [Noviherbaspirillum sp.]|nr:catalase [Noviherbaspirillum sp.]